VDFVLRRDLRGRYKFAAMQTQSGRELLIQHGIDPVDPLSFLLLEGEQGYTDTDAIVRILRSFGPGSKFVALLVTIVRASSEIRVSLGRAPSLSHVRSPCCVSSADC
jgi:predicted DCC family thiol-disulfide oxidoreductase YuxK